MFNALKCNRLEELTVDEMRLTDGGMIIYTFSLSLKAIAFISKKV